jgi:hypothetical protein
MRSPRIAVVGVVMLGMFLGAGNLRAQAPDPLAGTWHLNVQKSKYSPGPAPKSVVLKVEQTAKGMKTTSDAVLADGQSRHTEFTAPLDGTDVPLTGSMIADTVSVKSDGHKRLRLDKKGGKVVMTYNGTVSADGKTFTVEQKGTGEKGEAVNNQLIFEKH